MEKTKLKEIQLEILREIKRICKKNNIIYFLDAGTLLGAVRHKGMIPWDDDIDLGMLREDYEKFSEIAPKELDANFYYQSWDNDVNFGLPFAKVRKKNTHLIEKASMYSGQNDGIFIDIFPFDNYPVNRWKRVKQKKMLYVINKLMLAKCGYVVWTREHSIKYGIKKTIYQIIKWISKHYTSEQLRSRYKKVATQYNNQYSDYYIPQAGDGQYAKWLIPHECLEGFVDLEFENELYPCPQNYDLYLKSFYGDYMKLPPVEERKSMHNIVKIIIDDVIEYP